MAAAVSVSCCLRVSPLSAVDSRILCRIIFKFLLSLSFSLLKAEDTADEVSSHDIFVLFNR